MKELLLCRTVLFKRLSLMLLTIILCFTTLTGCTSKSKEDPTPDEEILDVEDEEEEEEEEEEEVAATTVKAGNSGVPKASPLVESYTRYLEEKNAAIELLNSSMEGDQALYLMSVVGITLMDIMVLNISVCGTPDLDAKQALQFMGILDAKYEYKNNSCQITYQEEEDGELSIRADYDPSSDSMQFNVSTNNKTSLIYEYAKMKQGYASQYQSFDEEGTSEVALLYFTSDEVRLSMHDSDQFSSIYRKGNASLDDVPELGLYIHYADGITTITDNQ